MSDTVNRKRTRPPKSLLVTALCAVASIAFGCAPYMMNYQVVRECGGSEGFISFWLCEQWVLLKQIIVWAFALGTIGCLYLFWDWVKGFFMKGPNE